MATTSDRVTCVLSLLCHDPKVKLEVFSKPFLVSVGDNQGSTLSPLLFALVMDTATWDMQCLAPNTLLYLIGRLPTKYIQTNAVNVTMKSLHASVSLG